VNGGEYKCDNLWVWRYVNVKMVKYCNQEREKEGIKENGKREKIEGGKKGY
jgi:hypothetical protein